ncbi:hypothetical protein BACERE00187_03224 [Bacillus cereus]|nr:Uncharacterised protein [Streptococcus pneumoniae]SMD60445.1 hypothetical protein BACERE00184_00128 [Bacillus cereus]SMD62713.1 hypothetical protein BACERE00196_00312 [Bacillus cereus]SMD72224.1 hypothetical protein BACERE00188_00280 [Bacillus cereus]SME09511.1 hypothetical protein BACERE00187_03224 [Bacillus cereus]
MLEVAALETGGLTGSTVNSYVVDAVFGAGLLGGILFTVT